MRHAILTLLLIITLALPFTPVHAFPFIPEYQTAYNKLHHPIECLAGGSLQWSNETYADPNVKDGLNPNGSLANTVPVNPKITVTNIDCSPKMPNQLKITQAELPPCRFIIYHDSPSSISSCPNTNFRNGGIAECEFDRGPTLPGPTIKASFTCVFNWEDPTHTPCPSAPPESGAVIMIAQDEDSSQDCLGEQLKDSLENVFPFNQVSIGVMDLSGKTMDCHTEEFDVLHCNDPAIISAVNAPIPIVITSVAGRGSYSQGVVHLWSSFSDAGTTSHELGHMLAGFGDEYVPDSQSSPGSESEQTKFCSQNIQYPNIHYFPPNSNHTDAEVRQLLPQIPWSSFISVSIPLTHNGKIGSDPGNYPISSLALFSNNRCGAQFDAVTPHPHSFMENSNLAIPPYHMYVLTKAMNAYLGTNISVPNPLQPTPTPCTSSSNSPTPTPHTTASPTASPSCSPSPTAKPK